MKFTVKAYLLSTHAAYAVHTALLWWPAQPENSIRNIETRQKALLHIMLFLHQWMFEVECIN
jgi:hypothetical protein